MTTITTIIITVVIGLLIIRQVLKKKSDNSLIDKLRELPLTLLNRLVFYILLAGISIVIPYILIVIFIIGYGDREDGMTKAVIPGLLTVQFIFGLIFIKHKIGLKLFLTCLLTASAFGLVWLGMTNKIIKTGYDLYQFWDLAVTNFIAGLIVWETYYHIDKKVGLTRKCKNP